jgi:hypothetical protein
VIDPCTPVNNPDGGGMLRLLMEAGHSARKWRLQRAIERASCRGLLRNRDDAACRRPQGDFERGLMPWA